MPITGRDLTDLPYYRDPRKPWIKLEAQHLSRWLAPYDDRSLYPQEGDRMMHIGLRRAQYAIYRHPARFRVAATGRRLGKTILDLHELIRAAQTGRRKEVGIAYPTLKDAKRLAWLPLKRMIPPDMIGWKNETTLELGIRGFESRIRLFGADRAESIYGEGLDFLIIDEAQSVPEQFWVQYASPTLVDKQGEALITFRPEGLNWCYDLMVAAEDPANADWQAFEFTTLDGENVPQSEIERERRQKTDWQFKQEYEASFQNPTGQVYKEFIRSINVSPQARDLGGPLLVGMDFNVAPFCMIFASKTPDNGLYVYAEEELWGAHTGVAIDVIKQRFPQRSHVLVYPDPSGRQRKTSGQGLTDFHLLAQAGFRVIAPTRTPPVKDRINTVQAMFRNAAGEHRLKIHPRCKRLIRSLEGLSYGENNTPDKSGGFDHMTDALGYLVWSLFPLIKYQTGMARLVG